MPAARRDPKRESLAGTAGDRVRAIIEAAEESAAAIRAEAEAEAERIRAQAEERASALRNEAHSDVQGLVGSIREAVVRLNDDFERLERRLSEPAGAPQRAEPAPANSTAVNADDADEDPDIALAEDAAVGLDEAPGAELEAARLVALNMALDGASREDVARHLRENHGVSEPRDLLDEVYESIGRS